MRQLTFEAHAAPLPGDDAVAYRALSSGPPVLFCCGLGTGVVGFHSQIAHLEGRYNRQELRDRGIFATRQLAKRQLTWLRRWDGAVRFDCLADDLADRVLALVRERVTSS